MSDFHHKCQDSDCIYLGQRTTSSQCRCHKTREQMLDADLDRAIAVIADLCGAGRPGVKESAEDLAQWAEEFTDRYFDGCTLSSHLKNSPVSAPELPAQHRQEGQP